MLNLLYDFVPVALFFIIFKLYGIYAATVVGIIATAAQLLIRYLRTRVWDRQLLITFVVFVFFGGLTLYFHNPIFVKWKPTIIFWIFSIVLLTTHFVGKKPLMQRLLEPQLQKSNAFIPDNVWKKLNLSWMIFFFLLGSLNLYVAYGYSTDAWVNFKLYGTMGLLLTFSIIQSIFLARYLKNE